MAGHTLHSMDVMGPTLLDRLLEASAALPAEFARLPRARALRWLRMRLGFKQTELAERSGVSQSQISRIEGGGDALMSTWAALFEAMGLELRLAPASALGGEELCAALRRSRPTRDHRQGPRTRARQK